MGEYEALIPLLTSLFANMGVPTVFVVAAFVLYRDVSRRADEVMRRLEECESAREDMVVRLLAIVSRVEAAAYTMEGGGTEQVKQRQ